MAGVRREPVTRPDIIWPSVISGSLEWLSLGTKDFWGLLPHLLEQGPTNEGPCAKRSPPPVTAQPSREEVFTFFFSNGWKKIQRRIFCDTWKWYEIQMSVSTNKALLEQNKQSCPFIYSLWLLAHHKGRVGLRPQGPDGHGSWNIYYLPLTEMFYGHRF